MRALSPLAIAALAACCSAAALAEDRPVVVAVNHSLEFIAERLLGDAADVVFPVPADVDPSFWRPSISDISMIQSADLILLNGAGFATWVDRVSLPRARVVNTSAAVEDQFITTESITHSHGDGGEHSHEGLASYLWLDPMLALAQAEAVAGAITRRDLAPSDEVTARLDALRTELETLDAETASALQGVQGIPMIATHPRYHYFARRYGLSISYLEWEAGAMPTDEELSDLKGLAERTGAKVLLWEAEPPEAAIAAAAALSLQSVTFPPLAHAASGADFPAAFAEAATSMADIAGQRASD